MARGGQLGPAVWLGCRRVVAGSLLAGGTVVGTLSFYRCWTPGSVPLPRLIAIVAAKWRIEEVHQPSKQAAGLDSGPALTHEQQYHHERRLGAAHACPLLSAAAVMYRPVASLGT